MGAVIKITLAALLAIMFVPGISNTAVHAEERATVIKEFRCGIIPEDSGLPFFLDTFNTLSVETSSGNTILKCTFDIPAGFEPSTTMQFKGFVCGTFLGVTTNSQTITTPGVKVHLTCIINVKA